MEAPSPSPQSTGGAVETLRADVRTQNQGWGWDLTQTSPQTQEEGPGASSQQEYGERGSGRWRRLVFSPGVEPQKALTLSKLPMSAPLLTSFSPHSPTV